MPNEYYNAPYLDEADVLDHTGIPGVGGGSVGGVRVLGPFSFSFNDVGLFNGISFYTPTINDLLVDAWIEVDTAWDGTTPTGDFGTFIGNTAGFISSSSDIQGIDMTKADDEVLGTGYLNGHYQIAPPANLSLAIASGTKATHQNRGAPGRFVTSDPLLIVVSQDGSSGGGDPGASQGSASIYLIIATPSLP